MEAEAVSLAVVGDLRPELGGTWGQETQPRCPAGNPEDWRRSGQAEMDG